MPHAHPRRCHARAAVLSTLFMLPALGLALAAAIERAHAGWDDYEQAVVLARLRDRTAEFPGRPLELVLGSSRSMNAFDTDSLSADPGGPLVVNLSLVGSNPLNSLLELRRVVAEGHRPRAVTLEVLPFLIRDFGGIRARGYADLRRVRAADLPTLSRVAPGWAPRLWRDFAAYNVCRWHTLRADLAAEALPAFASKDRVGRRGVRESMITPYGWCPLRLDPVPPEVYDAGLKVARGGYEPLLKEMEAVDPVFDVVMAEFFGYCRRQGIAVRAVVITPEAADFRAFYGPGVQRRIGDHVGEVCRRHGVRLVDAREWLPDDCFVDGHHLTERGGRAFTRRFAREVTHLAGRTTPVTSPKPTR